MKWGNYRVDGALHTAPLDPLHERGERAGTDHDLSPYCHCNPERREYSEGAMPHYVHRDLRVLH